MRTVSSDCIFGSRVRHMQVPLSVWSLTARPGICYLNSVNQICSVLKQSWKQWRAKWRNACKVLFKRLWYLANFNNASLSLLLWFFVHFASLSMMEFFILLCNITELVCLPHLDWREERSESPFSLYSPIPAAVIHSLEV